MQTVKRINAVPPVHALAGELDLDIYVISLSKRNMDDGDLQQLISMLPSRAIALMEDIDVAFTRASAALQEPDSKLTPPATPYARMRGIGGMDIGSSSSGITLAGLLAAIDGVAAQEGRILFATTNRYSALDPALRRPGRLDVHVEFRPANREQIRKLFTRFYPADPHANVTAPTSTTLVSSDIERPEASTVVETKEATLVEISDEKEMKEEPTSLIVTKVEGKDKAPSLVAEQLAALAKEFASLVPDGELSMASIQGHLMRYKTRPHEAVKQTLKWVEQERKQKRDAQTISMMDHLGVAIASPIAASAN
jgi:mitochondrial chaperone BCS1